MLIKQQIEWIKLGQTVTVDFRHMPHIAAEASIILIFSVGYEKFSNLTGQLVIKNQNISASPDNALARKMANTPLCLNWSLTRQENGEQAYWCHRAKSGAWASDLVTLSNYLGNRNAEHYRRQKQSLISFLSQD